MRGLWQAAPICYQAAMSRPAAIIFDLDDTLIDRPGRVQESWRGALAEIPELTARHTVDEVIAVLDRARERAWSDPRRRAGPALDYRGARAAFIEEALSVLGFSADDGLAKRLNEGISNQIGRTATLNPHALPILAALQAAKIPLALLTNGESRTQRTKIEQFALAPYFAHILIEEEIGAGKPFDAAYVAALACFTCPACDVWFVGDHLENDIAGPLRHGMRTVWYNPKGHAAPDAAHARADAEITVLSEVLDLFDLVTAETVA